MTKVNVMLGGPHPLIPSHTTLPIIMKHLASHLGYALPEPLLYRSHSHTSCIPTSPQPVGHLERMDELRDFLKGTPWHGRLATENIGAGVNVGDCLEASRRSEHGWM